MGGRYPDSARSPCQERAARDVHSSQKLSELSIVAPLAATSLPITLISIFVSL